MAYVNELNVGGTSYDVQDKRLPESSNKITLSKDLDVNGNFTANEIVEKMSGYSATISSYTGWTIQKVYISACKNGNKLTFVVALNLTKTSADATAHLYDIVNITIPSSIGAKIYPTQIGEYYFVDTKVLNCFANQSTFRSGIAFSQKPANDLFQVSMTNLGDLVVDQKYYARYEVTILLSDDIAA